MRLKFLLAFLPLIVTAKSENLWNQYETVQQPGFHRVRGHAGPILQPIHRIPRPIPRPVLVQPLRPPSPSEIEEPNNEPLPEPSVTAPLPSRNPLPPRPRPPIPFRPHVVRPTKPISTTEPHLLETEPPRIVSSTPSPIVKPWQRPRLTLPPRPVPKPIHLGHIPVPNNVPQPFNPSSIPPRHEIIAPRPVVRPAPALPPVENIEEPIVVIEEIPVEDNPESGPLEQPDSQSIPVPDPIPEPVPLSKPNPVPLADPEPEPEPIPLPQPIPAKPIVRPLLHPWPQPVPPRPSQWMRPAHRPRPLPMPLPNPVPQTVPLPHPKPQPVPPVPTQHEPELLPLPHHDPEPIPPPKPEPKPIPLPKPVPEPIPVPIPEPKPLPLPPPRPKPVQLPKPIPEPIWLPLPHHDPEPIPPPKPEPKPIPLPKPVPEPIPVPIPEPKPLPLPPPRPKPVPLPKPIPEPIPLPQPEHRWPVPKPLPNPKPAPVIPKPQPWDTSNKPVVTPKPYNPLKTPVIPVDNIVREGQLIDYNCKQDGYHSISNECDSYVECKKRIATMFMCPDGLHFNPNSLWPDYPCAYPHEVKCEGKALRQPAQPTSQCPRQYGYFPMNDGDCSRYLMCQEGMATVMDCPPGLVFNTDKSSCDWPENVPTCSPAVFQGFVCPPTPIDENGMPYDWIYKYRYGKSCKKYVACQRGHPRLLSCDAGLSFDEASESCIDADYVVNCSEY